MITLDNEDIYSQKDLDEEREQTIDRVLEIINKHINRYKKGKEECHDMTGVYMMCKAVAVDIKADVLALRGNNK